MALTNSYVINYGQLERVFEKIREGRAPEKFSIQHLKDLGFASSNYRAVIPLLKSLNFLSADGTPTNRYHEYRNSANSKKIMAEAIREAYSDIFVLKSKPTEADHAIIEGKFKSAHNAKENPAKLMANTFFSLLKLADLSYDPEQKPNTSTGAEAPTEETSRSANVAGQKLPPTFHYNIQIHLPATKDIEVFNAIFKSLREHLIE